MSEKLLKVTPIFDGKVITVERWEVEVENGKTAQREIVKHKGAAAIVPVDDEGNVYMVRQYRVALGRYTLEIPAGKLDSVDEDPYLCAVRELKEETGLTGARWNKLTVMDTSPGFCTERIHLYLAQGLEKGEANPDEDEFIQIQTYPLKSLIHLVMAGEIGDAKTALGLMMAAHRLDML